MTRMSAGTQGSYRLPSRSRSRRQRPGSAADRHTDRMNRVVSAELGCLVEVTGPPGGAGGRRRHPPRRRGRGDRDHARRTAVPLGGGARAAWRPVVGDRRPGPDRSPSATTRRGRHPSLAADAADELTYLRPSRFCESDRMVGFASRSPRDRRPEGSVRGLLLGRDPARVHLGQQRPDRRRRGHIARRARRLPRLRPPGRSPCCGAMEYPGPAGGGLCPRLDRMDFHAVAEAAIDGEWFVVDATLLAPRESLVRITTGRDAADTSFLSSYGGRVDIQWMSVTATVEGDLPIEGYACAPSSARPWVSGRWARRALCPPRGHGAAEGPARQRHRPARRRESPEPTAAARRTRSGR